ncbi:NAD-dependent succinate-semialdehyde dehydrogenase [Motiliproteus coralliicola]|uniref:NAD-dependent succinate-semialdehyde dehydrogenase n=1 Tax=Motiliproteus coralliicola TaxID=2283196 RepID=A0A369WJ26_9GAMM|nr:NAD-dependent succinate-semialdehyde dehydrogenase [Motiliproteus coralliicola]RDE19425.1 NAD-dependent succinate-semialdehyde dehydrogenase [Motiliproteus coralliicola]
MIIESRNPATGVVDQVFDALTAEQLEAKLSKAAAAAPGWRGQSYLQRGLYLRKVAELLRRDRESLAELMGQEMGKLKAEALGEVDKCALACDHYADNTAALLADQSVATAAHKSQVIFQPLGTVMGIMPWNFPLWQVFRFLAPTLMAGNTALLKHAPNVPGCALAVEALFQEAGLPEGVFSTLLISVEQTEALIADERIQGVAFTGSEKAGRQVATLAGQNLKKVVLELGGSDPLVVLEDANLEQAVEIAVKSRFSNAGQICIAAKRFILVDAIADRFVELLKERVAQLQPGSTLAPMAREDLRAGLHAQVQASIYQGAKPLCGCDIQEGDGYFYQASILDQVQPGMTAFDEELFGPVATIVRVADEQEALRMANATRFGLGASVWTADLQRGEAFARGVESGCCFVNAMVGSDVRLPFGGIKASGLGRELGSHGLMEFCNVKTVWIDA